MLLGHEAEFFLSFGTYIKVFIGKSSIKIEQRFEKKYIKLSARQLVMELVSKILAT